MNEENTLINYICEAKRKVSFSQKSSIETKIALKDVFLKENGYSFPISKGEAIESALFHRKTRDCRGDLIRDAAVRRFRRIGSDEWLSIDSSISNDIWNNDFKIAEDDEILKQLDAGYRDEASDFSLEVNMSNQTKKMIKLLLIGSVLAATFILLNKEK